MQLPSEVQLTQDNAEVHILLTLPDFSFKDQDVDDSSLYVYTHGDGELVFVAKPYFLKLAFE